MYLGPKIIQGIVFLSSRITRIFATLTVFLFVVSANESKPCLALVAQQEAGNIQRRDADATPGRGQDHDSEIRRKVEVLPKLPGASIFPDARIDLGEVECGKKYQIKLTLSNRSGGLFNFEKVGAGCSCVSLKVTDGNVPEGKEVMVEAEISIPEKTDPVLQLAIDFFENKEDPREKRFFSVHMQSTHVRGLCSFGAVPTSIQVGNSLKQFSIPLNVTEPIDAAALKIENSESLDGAVLSIGKSERDRPVLIIDIAGFVFDEGFRDCWVRITDKETGRGDEANFILEKAPMVSVSPRLITFVRKDQDQPWKANAFLVLDESLLEPDLEEDSKPEADDSKRSNPTLNLKGEVAGQAVETKCTMMRDGLYRLELSLPASFDNEDEQGEANWSVRFGTFERDLVVLWRISR